MLLLLVGCLDPISNRLFFEDAEFLDALPSAEDDRVQVYTHSADSKGDDDVTEPGEELVAPEGAPLLLVLTFTSVNDVNAMVDSFLSVVDAVRAIPPTSRTDDSRVWGPFPMDNLPGFEARMVSTRKGPGQFTWSFDAAPEGTSDWTSFFYGMHLAGEPVREGAGWFAYDGVAVDALHASEDNPFYLHVTYDHTVGSDITFSVWDDVASSFGTPVATWHYAIDPDHSGSFSFETADPRFAIDGKSSGKPEHWEVTTRWIPDVGGRGDATVSEGDLGNYTIKYTECWLPDATLLYQGDNWGFVDPPIGSEEDCTVSP